MHTIKKNDDRINMNTRRSLQDNIFMNPNQIVMKPTIEFFVIFFSPKHK